MIHHYLAIIFIFVAGASNPDGTKSEHVLMTGFENASMTDCYQHLAMTLASIRQGKTALAPGAVIINADGGCADVFNRAGGAT